MRDSLIVAGVCVAAIIVGGALYLWGPSQFHQVPEVSVQPVSAGSASVSTAAKPISANESTVSTDGPVSFTVLNQGDHAAQVATRKNYAAYDAEEFAKLWSMAAGSDTALPAVDFSKNFVIGVFMGQQSTGGYSIAVSKVTDAKNTRTVYVTLTKPGAGCMTSEALTRPYQLIVVPNSYNTLAHADSTKTAACGS